MNGHVFQCHNEVASSSQFQKTVEALEEYVNKTLEYAKDLKSLCKTYEVRTIAVPTDLTTEDQESKTKKLIWKTEVQTHIKRVDMQESNLQKIFSTIWGQCSATMKSKIESLDEYEERNETCDCAWLLTAIKGITHKFEGTRYVFLSLDDARTNFYSYKQKKSETLHEYLRHFSSLIEVLEHYGAKMGSDDVFIDNVANLVAEEAPGETAPLVIVAAYRARLVAAA